MNKIKQWDSVWKTKKINSDYSLKLYNFLATIGEGLCPTSKVLEVGCGSGQGLKNFPMSIAVGLDISKEALKLARNHNNNLVLTDISCTIHLPHPLNYLSPGKNTERFTLKITTAIYK